MGMKKKDIEKVFQEKLQDLSQIPEEHVWERVSASLDKRKSKRRVLPIWWRIAGVAAVLIAGLFLFLPSGELPSPEEPISDTPPEIQIKPRPGQVSPENSDSEEFPVAVSDEGASEKQESLTDQQEFTGTANGNQKENEDSPSLVQNELAKDDATESPKDIAQKEASYEKDPLNSKAKAIAQSPSEKDRLKESVIPATSEERIVQNGEKDPTEAHAGLEENKEAAKPSILEALAVEEEELTEEKPARRWEVGPRVAPVYFSSLAQGSPIHSSFRDNAKSGNVNMSYGVAVTYELGKRLKVRSGVHRVDFGYDTQDVSFSSSLNANTNRIINNINYNLSSRNLVVRSNTESGKMDLENAQDVAGPDPSLNGKMVQEFGYLEVPLELTYEVLDRKVGINLVGGVSSLFLTNNTVVLEANGNITEMGEANNINDLNFSTNFGVGVSYQINDKIRLNLEPVFKYQLNTFSDTSGNFQPFSMGVYSGLNFRF